MKNIAFIIVIVSFFSCEVTENVEPADNLDNIFTFPRTPRTSLSPGQHFSLEVPEGQKVLITDIYIENLGNGFSVLEILEQSSENSFEVRYTFRTDAGQATIINYTTGLMLGDEQPIAGSIRIQNATGSQASILPRINGKFIDE